MDTSEGRKKEIQNELESLQSGLEISLSELRTEINSLLDVRHWVHRYPLSSAGISLLIGFILARSAGKNDKVPKFTNVLMSEFRKFATRRAAKFLVSRIEDNLDKKQSPGHED